ncbi:MAG: hypothetical protein WA210_05695 [Burkholderiaceae bacterium]
MQDFNRRRRAVLGAAITSPLLAALHGCAQPLPVSLTARATPAGQSLLNTSAVAHGLTAYKELSDLSVSYDGVWRALIDKLQPVLVDPSFRGKSEERMLLRDNVIAQAYSGPGGRKFVLRRPSTNVLGEVRVWFNGEEARDSERRAAAALVADAYRLFLLGPMLLAERNLVMELGGVETVNSHSCDVLRIQLAPGLGHSNFDQLALFIDRKERLMRRVRFSLDGLESTKGSAHEVDTFDHLELHGMRLPTRFQEMRVHPTLLPVRDWRLTGVDVNRGFTAQDLEGPELAGAARQAAAALPRRAAA